MANTPKNGDRVRDKLTGYVVIVIGITDWLYGCIRCGVESEKLHDGKPITPQWLDVQRLEVVQANALSQDDIEKLKAVGGQRPDPVR